ncbi:MAG TPA: AAA family ATPase, partial [Acidimicrobiales bacterium]
MLIKSIRMQNFRAFEDSGWVPLGRITVVIGKNNSGKSSLVRAFGILQEGTIQWQRDARLRSELTTIELRGPGEIPPWIPQGEFELMSNWKQNTAPQSLVGKGDAGVDVNFNRSDGKRPLNPIVPLLSRRRPTVFQESINLDSSRQVQIDGSMLAARLSGWID